jgi:hypothetical protein
LLDVVQTSIPEYQQPKIFEVQHPQDDAPHLKITPDKREPPIHIGRDPCQDLALQDAIVRDQDLHLHVRARQEEEADDETALDAMVADEEEAQVIAAIAAMMIGAEAEVEGMVEVGDVADVNNRFVLQRWSLGRKIVPLQRYQRNVPQGFQSLLAYVPTVVEEDMLKIRCTSSG